MILIGLFFFFILWAVTPPHIENYLFRMFWNVLMVGVVVGLVVSCITTGRVDWPGTDQTLGVRTS